MKTIIKTLGIVGASFFGFNSYGQTQDTTNYLREFLNMDKTLDSLEIIAVKEYNNGKIEYNNCIEQCIKKETRNFHCVGICLEYISKSKKALEEYVSLFGKFKVYDSEDYTLRTFRDLNINESKEWIENEEKLIKLLNDFLNNPSREKENAWIDQYENTLLKTNSYFPEEGILYFNGLLDE